MVAEVLPLRLTQGVVGHLRLLLALVSPDVEARVDRRGGDARTGAVVACPRVGRADEVRREASFLGEVQPVLDEVHHHGRAKGEVERRPGGHVRRELRLRMAVEEQVGLTRLEPQGHASAAGAVPRRGHRRRRRARVTQASELLQGLGLGHWLGLGLGRRLVSARLL